MLRNLTWLLVMALAWFPMVAYSVDDTSDPPQPSLDELLTKAAQYFETNDLDNTISTLTQAAKIATTAQDTITVHNALGWSYYTKKEYGQAEAHYKAALLNAVESGDQQGKILVRNNLGILYFSTDEIDNALPLFKANMDLNDEFATRYYSLSLTIEKQREARGLVRQGAVFSQNEEFEQAVEKYDAALALDPNNEDAMEYKGYALFRLGRYNESLTFSKLAFRIKGTFEPLVNIFKAYCGQGDLDEAKGFAGKNHDAVKQYETRLRSERELKAACENNLETVLSAEQSMPTDSLPGKDLTIPSIDASTHALESNPIGQ